MVADATTKPHHNSHHHHSSGDNHKQLDREVRDMVSAITTRVSHLHNDHGSTHGHHDGDDDGHGVRIITLAGTNTGATLKSELDDEKAPNHHHLHGGDHNDTLRTYVNSNFQAINNSIMMGGSYTTNDPGVHMDIADLADDHGHGPHGHKDKKKKKKDKESSKSEHHSQGSD